MPTLPADEDYAKSILAIFHANHVRPGQTLRASQVEAEFLASRRGAPSDCEAGLRYAVDRRWLRVDLNMIRLTQAGLEET
jgi:hypothetical protein